MLNDNTSPGQEIYNFACLLWPMNRSITGDGVRQTLTSIKEHIPSLNIFEVPTGMQVFDWTIPREWRVREAYILTPDGERICDFRVNNLHLVGYSVPFSGDLTLSELQDHLYSLPEQPDAIPYVTSYYKERWGFCLCLNQRESLTEGLYKVVVDSDLFEGSLTYGEIIIQGSSQQEVFLSTYICHPSIANNELSGMVVTTFLVKWLLSQDNLKYTYRIVFIPETIGSITYLSNHYQYLKQHVVAGFNITCVGDDRAYSYLPSRNGNSISDQVSLHVLRWIDPTFKKYTWRDRGSDERQYCSPGIDLPVASIMRTKYGEYTEYHTSLDDLERVVSPSGLQGSFYALQRAIETLERNCYPQVKVLGEPQLGKRGLYPTLSTKESGQQVGLMMNLLTWSDGQHSLLDIAEECDCPIWLLYPLVDTLREHGLLEI